MGATFFEVVPVMRNPIYTRELRLPCDSLAVESPGLYREPCKRSSLGAGFFAPQGSVAKGLYAIGSYPTGVNKTVPRPRVRDRNRVV